MNAKDCGKKKDMLLDSDDYIAEKKIDGARYLSVDGRMFSRRLSVKDGMPVEKTNNVPHIQKELQRLPSGTILDGEIYYPGGNSNLVTSVMGALPAKALARQEGNPIRYCVYDVLHYNGKDVTGLPWKERRDILEKLYLGHLLHSNHIDLSYVHYGDKRNFLDHMLKIGEEGIMLKNVNAAYHVDKRPEHVWYKVKKDYPIDVIIMGFESGKGKYDGQIGSVIFGQYDKPYGKIVRKGTCSGFTDALRLDMTKNQGSYLGRVMEIHAMEPTKAGAFRHPQFLRMRDDKSPRDCVAE
jgi:ATP-dependent DNA ligase